LLLAGQVDDAAALAGWPVPRLPIGGGELIRRGLTAGPAVARTLRAIERRWVEEGFPGGLEFDRIVTDALASATE
jgi:poly(A) polymerase